ncbi:hypothetical protein AOQ84DRAFT_353822 [Glonium stellatum]|uniref:Uncharacterized protein n=1 Tax=Glonium stellatum TaxID=574774 RepID=A0A8E2F3D3_9PEZI|nr:hypothetical protein AOQ84DRAFT_353822 [Glonium stellatum]
MPDSAVRLELATSIVPPSASAEPIRREATLLPRVGLSHDFVLSRHMCTAISPSCVHDCRVHSATKQKVGCQPTYYLDNIMGVEVPCRQPV